MTPAPSAHPPGPSGKKLLGSLLEIRRDRIRFVTEATRDYGDIVSFRMGPRRIYLLRHPDHLRHVLIDNHQNYEKGLGLKHAAELLGTGLLTSEGIVWERQRKDAGPVLANEANLAQFGSRSAAIVEKRVRRWKAGCAADFAREMVLLGIEITGGTMLGCDLGDVAPRIADDLKTISCDAMRRMTAALPGPWQRMSRQARSALRRMDEIVEHRLLHAASNGDTCFPGLLAAARANRRELRDQLLTLLLAGHETTASTLSWALHLLSLHPEWQRRVREELQAVPSGGVMHTADILKLRCTSMVLHETMRLYPPVWLLPRRAAAADTIGAYEIPRASDVLLSVYSMHRHPGFWPAPDDFMPERFDAGASYRAYMPFGSGPRTCVGRRLGILEATITLAGVLRAFHFLPVPEKKPGACASLTLHPSPGLWLTPVRCPANAPGCTRHEGKSGEERKPELG